MSELRAILVAARALRCAEEPLLLATVVRVRGSSYRRPGARVLVAGARCVAGTISGGCLERDVVAKGAWRTRERRAVTVMYDGTSDDEVRVGSGCDGVVELLVERLDGDAWGPLDAMAKCLNEERIGAAVTVIRSTRRLVPVGARLALDTDDRVVSTVEDDALRAEMAVHARAALASGRGSVCSSFERDVDWMIEPILPAPHLFVIGSGYDAVPVVALAKSTGWSVTVYDGEASFATAERFSSADRRLVGRNVRPEALTAVIDACARPVGVIMSHAYEADRDALAALLASRARYIGVLGPRRRTERMLAELARSGVALTDERLRRLHSPVGLHLGAETPEEIALAIVAEVQAALTGTHGGRLRERRGPIHAAHEGARPSARVLVGTDAE
jgi:xanthine/CO dehydrogenase XdhC/CoxF family maturation factor